MGGKGYCYRVRAVLGGPLILGVGLNVKRGTVNKEIAPRGDANIGETVAERSENFDRLRFLNEQVFREQEIYWQRFYSFATIHAGAFVLYAAEAIKPHSWLITSAGVLLGFVWLWVQWASLWYVDRHKKAFHDERTKMEFDFPSHWLFSRPWASSTNAGLLVVVIVWLFWVLLLYRIVWR